MNTNTPTRQQASTPTRPLIIFSALMSFIAVVFLVAVAMGIAWWMTIILVVLFVALAALLSWIANKFMAVRIAWHNVNLEALKEDHRHAEKCIASGYNPNGYTPLAHRIEAPAQAAPMAQLPAAKGIQFDSADMEANAVNLLLYSCKLLGRESNRIASNPECAAANIPGYNGRKWDAIINKHLKQAFDIATVPGPVDNGGGAFVPPEIGTVGAFYDLLTLKKNGQILDGAVAALPEVKRTR